MLRAYVHSDYFRPQTGMSKQTVHITQNSIPRQQQKIHRRQHDSKLTHHHRLSKLNVKPDHHQIKAHTVQRVKEQPTKRRPFCQKNYGIRGHAMRQNFQMDRCNDDILRNPRSAKCTRTFNNKF